MTLYHGGIADKRPGDILVPSPPHTVCGCPVCAARAAGRTCTVAEYRVWAGTLGARGRPLLEMLRDADPSDPIDPPSQRAAVYVTTDRGYARWYAARSQGSLYVVAPIGPVERSAEDHFPTWTCAEARVLSVEEARVRLIRSDRREMMRRWKKADKRAEAMRS